VELSFYGAAQTVTGSQYLLAINGQQLLLECGLYQGKREESYERNQHFPFDPRKVDAVILSHAHIDHSGNLPNLVKNGYNGPIFATLATVHLCDIMLRDSGHIHEYDTIYINKKRAKRGESPIEPLYTVEDAARVVDYFIPVDYGLPFEPLPGVSVRMMDAGHILGSAAVDLEISEKANGGIRTTHLWFSGDIGRRGLPIIRDPILPTENVDYMIMECTYGDKPHRSPEQAYEELRDAVRRTVGRGGKVIIPAFAVGRTQELVFDLHRMIESGDIPRIPVYVDSPLAVYASNIYRDHPECMDLDTSAFMRTDNDHDALGFGLLHYIKDVEESKSLNDRRDPMVIISASGMAETGRILHHLKNNIENKRNTILIVGWQAPDTLGRRLAERAKEVRIFDELYEVRAEIITIGVFSAHAGQDLLLEYAQTVKDSAKQIFLVHGEEKAELAFADCLKQAGIDRFTYPDLNAKVKI
jgi:metallo-beta-lactamase family protein